ncbi:MAG: hypothetical protein HY664_01260 [Chloroflexi bacterium]|nr:hypothetical protein [Chloroflexota bacterium]
MDPRRSAGELRQKMRRSVLIYRDEGPESGSTKLTIIALHGSGGTFEQLLPLARSLGEGVRIYSPEAPRPVFPHYGQREGQLWFFVQDVGVPEAPLFGDSLYQVEQFLWDVAEEEDAKTNPRGPIFLLGYDQGAVLALSLGCLWPELLGGVISLQGYLPEVPGWALPDIRMNGLPILLVYDPEPGDPPVDLVKRSAAELTARGAQVTVEEVAGAGRLTPSVSGLLSTWLSWATVH